MQTHKCGTCSSTQPKQSIVYEYGWTLYSRNTMDVADFVVSINDVILNRSYRDMKVRAFYVKSLHKIGTMKLSLLGYNNFDFNKIDYFIYRYQV